MAKKRRTKIEETPVIEEEVKIEAPEEIVEPPKKIFKGKVRDVDILNIRNKPYGDVIAQIRRGNIIIVNSPIPTTETNNVNEASSWYPVTLNGKINGWAMARYLLVFEDGDYKEV